MLIKCEQTRHNAQGPSHRQPRLAYLLDCHG